MVDKVVDFINYRKLKMTEIQLDLTDNHLGVLIVSIADEVATINKQLATLKHSKNKMKQNEYNYFYRAKESLINVTEKIEKYFYEAKSLTVTFNELDCIVGTIESKLQDLIWIERENTPEYQNLCFVHKSLTPVYDKNKAIWEELKADK